MHLPLLKLSDLYTSLSSFINLSVAWIDPHTVPCNKSIKNTLHYILQVPLVRVEQFTSGKKNKKSSGNTSYRWPHQGCTGSTDMMNDKKLSRNNERFLFFWNYCQCLKQQLHKVLMIVFVTRSECNSINYISKLLIEKYIVDQIQMDALFWHEKIV